MKANDIVGADGKNYFCKNCGRTFPSYLGVIGHQRSCPAKVRVKQYSVYNNSLGNCDTQMGGGGGSASSGAPRPPRPQLSARSRPQLSNPSAQPSAQFSDCDSEGECQYSVINNETELLQVANLISRTYRNEQEIFELKRHVNNDLTHLNAVCREEGLWGLPIKNLVLLAFGAGAFGWWLRGAFGGGEQENPVKKNSRSGLGDLKRKVGDQLVNRGVNKFIDNVFRKF